MKTQTNKTTRETQYRKALGGIGQHLAAAMTFVLGGATVTKGDLVSVFQSELDALASTESARLAHLAAVEHEKATFARASPMLHLFQDFVRLQFGHSNAAVETLADFGMIPKRPRKKLSADAKAIASAKAKATRAAKKAHAASPGPVAPAAPVAPAPAAPAGPIGGQHPAS